MVWAYIKPLHSEEIVFNTREMLGLGEFEVAMRGALINNILPQKRDRSPLHYTMVGDKANSKSTEGDHGHVTISVSIT